MIVWVGICSEWFSCVRNCLAPWGPHLQDSVPPTCERAPFREEREEWDQLNFAASSLCTHLLPSLPISDAHFLWYWSQTVLGSKPGSATQQSEHEHHVTPLKPSVSSALGCSTVFTELLSTWDDAWTGYLLTTVVIVWGEPSFCVWGLTSTPEALCLDLNCRLTTLWANCDWVWLPCTSSAGPEICNPVTRPSMSSPLCSSLVPCFNLLTESGISFFWPMAISPRSKLLWPQSLLLPSSLPLCFAFPDTSSHPYTKALPWVDAYSVPYSWCTTYICHAATRSKVCCIHLLCC